MLTGKRVVATRQAAMTPANMLKKGIATNLHTAQRALIALTVVIVLLPTVVSRPQLLATVVSRPKIGIFSGEAHRNTLTFSRGLSATATFWHHSVPLRSRTHKYSRGCSRREVS